MNMEHLPAKLAVFMMANLILCKSDEHADRKTDLTCNEVHNGTSEGTLRNPMYPDNDYGDKFCNYHVTVPSDNQVALSFTKLKFIHSDTAIFVFDGADCRSRLIGYVWHPDNNPLISSGNSITALLAVQNRAEVWRFKGNYFTDDCGGEFRGLNGNFSFRTNASRLVVCIWRITVTPGRKVQLIFKSLTIPAFNPLLRVLDGSTCGGTMLSELSHTSSIPPNGVVSNSNTMTVVYTETIFATELTNIDATFLEIITEDTTTTGMRARPSTTVTDISMKPTDGVITEDTTTTGTRARPSTTVTDILMKPTDGVITEDTTTTGTRARPSTTVTDISMKPTDGVTKVACKFPFTLLVGILLLTLIVLFN